MARRPRWRPAAWILPAACLTFAGCGTSPATGGTPGRLASDGNPLADFQVTVHRCEADQFQRLGCAVTAADGSFRLATDLDVEPLWLEPGDYRVTLESVGSPVAIPAEYGDVDRTPLRIHWNDDEQLSLNVPGLRHP